MGKQTTRRPGRPKKPAAELRNRDVRIPVNAEEKKLITEAAWWSDEGEFAAWARRLLLAEARRVMAAARRK